MSLTSDFQKDYLDFCKLNPADTDRSPNTVSVDTRGNILDKKLAALKLMDAKLTEISKKFLAQFKEPPEDIAKKLVLLHKAIAHYSEALENYPGKPKPLRHYRNFDGEANWSEREMVESGPHPDFPFNWEDFRAMSNLLKDVLAQTSDKKQEGETKTEGAKATDLEKPKS